MNSDFITLMPPAFILILGGFILPFFQDNAKRILIILLPILAFYQSWSINADVSEITFSIASFDLQLLFEHQYSKLFATIFCFMAFTGGIFGLKTAKTMESSAAFIYAGGALGVVFSGDLISFFLYWELMAVASAIVVFCGNTDVARRAGLRYSYVHFIGGVILLSGIISYIALGGSNAFTSLASSMEWMLTTTPDALSISLWLMLVGIIINAAVPPLATWLPDSYPSASPTGAVFLSAFTTKTAIFALLILFAGNALLIYIGLASMLYGIVYAMLQNNIRRTLAYGLISQVGLMMIGIGIGTEAALLAVSMVAFGHILYKGLWFMVTGAVIASTGRSRAHELGALWHHHKPLAVIAIFATLAMIAPLTTGFLGKTLLGDAMENSDVSHNIYLLVTASTAGMFMVLVRLLWQIFFDKAPDSPAKIKPIPINMYLAMGAMVLATILPALPVVYQSLLGFTVVNIPNFSDVYHFKALLSQSEVILFSTLAFFLLKPWFKTTSSTLLDFDWIYRVFLKRLFKMILVRVHYHYLPTALAHANMGIKQIIHSAYKLNGPKGIFSRSWNISTTVLWSVLLLGIYMALYYTA